MSMATMTKLRADRGAALFFRLPAMCSARKT